MNHPIGGPVSMAAAFLALAGADLAGTAEAATPCDESRPVAPAVEEDTTLASIHPPPARPYGPRQLAYDAAYLKRRPFELDRRDRVKLLTVGASTVFLYLMRDEIRDFVQDRRSPGRSRFLDDARTMGKGAFAPSLALIAYGASFATGNEREKETAFMLLESMGYSAAAAYGGSFILAAERPEVGAEIRFLDTDGRGVSLDAALAASVVPVLRRQYLRARPGESRVRRFVRRGAVALLYAGASLVAYQRLDQDRHWAPDVFLGVSAGLGMGRMLCEAHDEVERRKRGRSGVLPVPGGAGLVFEPVEERPGLSP